MGKYKRKMNNVSFVSNILYEGNSAHFLSTYYKRDVPKKKKDRERGTKSQGSSSNCFEGNNGLWRLKFLNISAKVENTAFFHIYRNESTF